MNRRAVVLLCWLAAVTVVACSDKIAEQVNMCERTIEKNQALTLMLGSEGTKALCSCAVDSLAARFPDASDRWVEYSTAVESRLERRGVLGMMLDTAWQVKQGREMTEFAAAHTEVIASCGAQLVGNWSRPAPVTPR